MPTLRHWLCSALLAAAAAGAAAESGREIAQLPFTLTQPGAYRLTADLLGPAGSSGITIAANDVTLDLNGFALRGAPGSIHGLYVPVGVTNLAVVNGTLCGWGLSGVQAVNASNACFRGLTVCHSGSNGLNSGYASTVEDCAVHDNGYSGLEVESGSVVRRCIVARNHEHGLDLHSGSTAEDCTLSFNGHDGLHGSHGCVVLRCVAHDNGAIKSSGDGIEMDTGSLVRECTAWNNEDGIKIRTGGGQVLYCAAVTNADDGIDVDGGCVVRGCTASYSSGGHGIKVGSNCLIINNVASYNKKSGIKLAGVGNRIEGNQSCFNDYGIRSDDATTDPGEDDSINNIFLRNTAAANLSNNYRIRTTNWFEVSTAPGTNFSVKATINWSL